jgi:hypothetical protein
VAERPDASSIVLRFMPAAKALSFLRDTRGLTTWTASDIADSLKISVADAKHVVALSAIAGLRKTNRGRRIDGHAIRQRCLRVEAASVHAQTGRASVDSVDINSAQEDKTQRRFSNGYGVRASCGCDCTKNG